MYHLLTSIFSNFHWILLFGYSLFRFFRYSATKYPKPDDVSRKMYSSWRELESSALTLAVTGMILSILFSLMMIPKTQEEYITYAGIRGMAFLAGLVIVIILQVVSKKKARKSGIVGK